MGKEIDRGMIRVGIELSNPRRPELNPPAVQALADTGAMTFCIPMEDRDLVVEPSRQTVAVNPESPNLPSAVVK